MTVNFTELPRICTGEKDSGVISQWKVAENGFTRRRYCECFEMRKCALLGVFPEEKTRIHTAVTSNTTAPSRWPSPAAPHNGTPWPSATWSLSKKSFPHSTVTLWVCRESIRKVPNTTEALSRWPITVLSCKSSSGSYWIKVSIRTQDVSWKAMGSREKTFSRCTDRTPDASSFRNRGLRESAGGSVCSRIIWLGVTRWVRIHCQMNLSAFPVPMHERNSLRGLLQRHRHVSLLRPESEGPHQKSRRRMAPRRLYNLPEMRGLLQQLWAAHRHSRLHRGRGTRRALLCNSLFLSFWVCNKPRFSVYSMTISVRTLFFLVGFLHVFATFSHIFQEVFHW